MREDDKGQSYDEQWIDLNIKLMVAAKHTSQSKEMLWVRRVSMLLLSRERLYLLSLV